jgi:hypothetical protein
MALSVATIPTIVSSTLLESLKENLVFAKLFNQNYTGDVRPGGTVKIPSIGAVQVREYTKYTPTTADNAADSAKTLTLDKQNYFSILLDDIDKVLAKPEVLGAYVKEGAYQLMKTVDADLSACLVAGATLTTGLGTSSVPIAVNSANIGAQLITMAKLMDAAGVPRPDRAVILPPAFVEKLVIANIAQSTDNASVIANGAVARYAGFDIYMSNAVANTSGAKYRVIAGHPDAATYAIGLENVETLRHPTIFADNLRGLEIHGSVVTRPGAICSTYWNIADEAEAEDETE